MRIIMTWFTSKNIRLEKEQFPMGCRFSSTPHEQFVFIEQTCTYEEVKSLYHTLAQFGLTCQSIQFYLEGALPDLTKYGFEKLTAGYSYSMNNVSISAVPYSENVWCYLIRGNRIIPFRALAGIPYFQDVSRQLTLFGGDKFYEKKFTCTG